MDKKYNVYNINAIILEPEAQMEKLVPQNFHHSSLFFCVCASILRLLKSIVITLISAPWKFKFSSIATYGHLYDGTILFRLPSLNNLRSLNNVIDKVKLSSNNVQVIEDVMNYDSFPIIRMNLISIWYLFDFWKGFAELSYKERVIVNYNMQNYVYTPGFVWFYKSMLIQHRPQTVVLANDHTFTTKPLELLCEDLNIPCIYVQHASVSYAFPELHFSYSFLDGLDSLIKYTSGEKQSKGKVFLIGAVRYDLLSGYRIRRDKTLRKCIGIAINKIDDNTSIDMVCEALLNKYPELRIKIRSHPAMKNRPFVFGKSERIIYTCATDETMIEYLDSIDLQISNDSGVHLDAILGGVRTIAYNFSKFEYGDNYNYVKNGLIHLAVGVNDLCKFIEDETYLEVNPSIVRQYDESFGKYYAGRCSDIIAEFILSNNDETKIKEKYALSERQCSGYQYYIATEE